MEYVNSDTPVKPPVDQEDLSMAELLEPTLDNTDVIETANTHQHYGFNVAAWEKATQNPEQRATNLRGLAVARAAHNAAKRRLGR